MTNINNLDGIIVVSGGNIDAEATDKNLIEAGLGSIFEHSSLINYDAMIIHRATPSPIFEIHINDFFKKPAKPTFKTVRVVDFHKANQDIKAAGYKFKLNCFNHEAAAFVQTMDSQFKNQ